MSKPRHGIYDKLIKVMGIQLLLISAVTLLGVYGAAKVVENVLIKQALEGEADFFWRHYSEDPAFHIPDTLNLTGYLAGSNQTKPVPDELLTLPLGYQRLLGTRGGPLVHISERKGQRLYLVFEESQVTRLAFYFGIAPLAFVLLVIYLPAWVTYVLSKRAISPVVKLSKKMKLAAEPGATGFTLDFSDIEKDADAEVMTLLEAFNQYAQQVDDYVQREKNFTRYASHELRTPLAVLKGSVALLGKQALGEREAQIVERMRPMIKGMEDLLDALLLLSRDQKPEVSAEPVSINSLLSKELEQVQRLFSAKPIQVLEQNHTFLCARVPERLFRICINNILYNAFNYTEKGKVTVTIQDSTIVVKDTGCGMSEAAIQRVFEPFYRVARDSNTGSGFGLGMSIVKRICDQMGWQIKVTSKLGQGTDVSLCLPNANEKENPD